MGKKAKRSLRTSFRDGNEDNEENREEVLVNDEEIENNHQERSNERNGEDENGEGKEENEENQEKKRKRIRKRKTSSNIQENEIERTDEQVTKKVKNTANLNEESRSVRSDNLPFIFIDSQTIVPFILKVCRLMQQKVK